MTSCPTDTGERDDGPSFLDDLIREVQQRGAIAVAEAGAMDVKRVMKFLRAPMECRISTLSYIARAVGMPIGEMHLVDRETGICHTCGKPRSEHYPLLPATS